MDREEIITAFKDALDEWRAPYKVDSPREGSIAISCGFKLESKISKAIGLFEFRQASTRIFVVPLVSLIPKSRSEMLRFVAMANQDMTAGCFEYEMETDGIRFRHFLDCDGFATLPRDLVCNTLLHPFQMFQRYGDAFVAVAAGTSDAATAFASVRPDDGGED